MAPVIRSVTVFCGSSDSVDRKYFAAAEELGAKLARRGWRLIYGGGGVGLMGSLARAVLAHGGEVTGIIPKALVELGVGDTGLTEPVVTDGLRTARRSWTSGATPSWPRRAASARSRKCWKRSPSSSSATIASPSPF